MPLRSSSSTKNAAAFLQLAQRVSAAIGIVFGVIPLTGFLAVIILPMLLFFVYQVYHLIMISIRLKKEVAIETAKEVELAKLKAREAAEAEMAKSGTDEEKQNEAAK